MNMTNTETPEALIARYIEECRRHDYFHAMSDDHSVWRRGQDHLIVISRLETELKDAGVPEQQIVDLWNEHVIDRGVAPDWREQYYRKNV